MAMSCRHSGLNEFQNEINRAGGRIALALITLGLYIAASLLIQHSIGPCIAGMPLLAVIGYPLALWLTFRIARGVSRRN